MPGFGFGHGFGLGHRLVSLGQEDGERGALVMTSLAGIEQNETSAITLTYTNNPILGLAGLAWYVDGAITPPTLSGSDVTGWTDLSGNGRNLNLASVAKPQTVDTVGMQCVAANSNDLTRVNTGLIGTGGYCIGLVLKIDSVIDNEVFFSNADRLVVGTGLNIKINGTTFTVDHYNAGVAVRDDTNVPADTTTYHVFIIDRSGSGVAPVMYRDGVNVTGFTGTANPIAAGAVANLMLGSFSGAGYSSSRIKAAFVCTAGIGSTNAAAVSAFLKAEHGTP